MANEIGPFTSAVKVAFLNPATITQVRHLTGSGSPNWLDLSTNPTFSESVATATQVGTTGLYFISIPTGLVAGTLYPIIVYDNSATAWTDSKYISAYRPNYPPPVVDSNGYTTAANAVDPLVA